MAAFVPGIEVSRRFYQDHVQPILQRQFDGLPHGAALMGRGSDVLGFDDEMSTDHDWGPHVLLFLRNDDDARYREHLHDVLRRELPASSGGRQGVCEIHTVRGFFMEKLAVDIEDELRARDWLTLPEHALRMYTAGVVFHDEVGVQAARDRLAYYPRDVWLYLLMTGWWRVHPEANLQGRAGAAGDDLGSALIGARLVSDLMRLAFLMERQYAPYSKWFGTAFSGLACGPGLAPILSSVVRAETWQGREKALLAAYAELAVMHNALEITAPVSVAVEQMWDRPFQVMWGDFPGALQREIRDPEVVSISKRWPLGPADRFRELLWSARDRRTLLRLFDEGR